MFTENTNTWYHPWRCRRQSSSVPLKSWRETRRTLCSSSGLPLAIELAAARIRMLAPAQVLVRLESRLEVLTCGAVDMPRRQQTLRRTIDWSHDLLSPEEQKLFRRLSVFVGGCTLEAAEAVCNTRRDLEIEVLEGITLLVDKSLMQQIE